MQTITIEDVEKFVQVISQLVREGLTFEAHEEDGRFVIKLLGGY